MLPSLFLAGVSLALVAAPGQTPPERPPAFRGAAAVAHPLDQRLAQAKDPRAVLEAGPEAWCPVSSDFRRWVEERARLGAGTSPATGAPAPSALSPGATGLSRSRAPAGRSHAGPAITLDPSGVVIMEDDGTLMTHDRRIDVVGSTFELAPQGDDYLVTSVPFAFDDVVGTQVLTDQRGWAETPVILTQFAFPFGGVPQSQVFVTSTIALFFTDPNPPGPAQLLLSDSLADRTPRIGVLQSGTSIYGWNAFVREDADRAVFTWRATDWWLDLDVQATLFSDGRILLSYRQARGVEHGSIVVVDGDAAWWADRAAMGSVTDPGGEVAIPPPDGPAIDVLELRAFQVGGSEVVEIETVLEAPLPADTDGWLQFAWEIRDESGQGSFATYWAEWVDGRWNWQYMPIEIEGNVIRFRLLKSDMRLTDDDFEITVWTAQNWNFPEAVTGSFTFPATPPTPVMRDFTRAPFSARGPVLEAFTLPDLNVYRVHEEFNEHFGSPRIDALAVYQNFYTDIIFFAGAYSTVGNNGADGVGAGNTRDPESPALLHMNTIRYGWNSWDEGKVEVLNHELGHHWLYFLSIDEAGVVGKPLGDGHPAGWTHTPASARVYNDYDASCMGGSTWTDNGDGTFTAAPTFASYGYSWHELYLMGLADLSEVTDWFYLRDSVPALPGAYWPPEGITVTATRVDVVAQQMVDAMGPRVPDRAGSRHDFVVPMVLVVRPGEWSQADVDEVAYTCDIWAPVFNRATAMRGTVRCDRVGLRPPDGVITTPAEDVVVVPYGSALSFEGYGVDLDGDPVGLVWEFDGMAPAANGPGPHDVFFPQEGEYRVTLLAVDGTGMEDPTPAETIVAVTCRPPTVPVTGLRVARDRSPSPRALGEDGGDELVFSWTPLSPEPDEYALFAMKSPDGTALVEQGAGRQGLRVAMPPGNWFYRVAAREIPGCLGPLTP